MTRDAAISYRQRDRAAAAFIADLPAWYVIEVTPEVIVVARRLLMQHVLRSGDAIQLASALVLQARTNTALQALVAYDHRLLDAARAEQLTVLGESSSA